MVQGGCPTRRSTVADLARRRVEGVAFAVYVYACEIWSTGVESQRFETAHVVFLETFRPMNSQRQNHMDWSPSSHRLLLQHESLSREPQTLKTQQQSTEACLEAGKVPCRCQGQGSAGEGLRFRVAHRQSRKPEDTSRRSLESQRPGKPIAARPSSTLGAGSTRTQYPLKWKQTQSFCKASTDCCYPSCRRSKQEVQDEKHLSAGTAEQEMQQLEKQALAGAPVFDKPCLEVVKVEVGTRLQGLEGGIWSREGSRLWSTASRDRSSNPTAFWIHFEPRL